MTRAEEIASERRPRKLKDRTRSNRKYPWVCTLRLQRQKLGLSMEDIADELHRSRQMVMELENGADPKLSVAQKLADLFGLTIQDLWPGRRE